MDKEKEKKQLIVLVVLVVLAGGVAIYMFGFAGDDKPKPAGDGQTADANAANGQNPEATGEGAAGADGKPAVKKVEVIEELPMPSFEGYQFEQVGWQWEKPIWERGVTREIGKKWPADPFRVLNIDVVDPERHAEIEGVKEAWQIQGVTRTRAWIEVPVLDEEGKPKVEEEQIVTVRKLKNIYEVWFKDKESPFKLGDRLTETRFKITQIFRNRDNKNDEGEDQLMGEGIVLTGDTGSTLVLWLAKD